MLYVSPGLILALKPCSIHYFLYKSRHFNVLFQICSVSNSILLVLQLIATYYYCSVLRSAAH